MTSCHDLFVPAGKRSHAPVSSRMVGGWWLPTRACLCLLGVCSGAIQPPSALGLSSLQVDPPSGGESARLIPAGKPGPQLLQPGPGGAAREGRHSMACPECSGGDEQRVPLCAAALRECVSGGCCGQPRSGEGRGLGTLRPAGAAICLGEALLPQPTAPGDLPEREGKEGGLSLSRWPRGVVPAQVWEKKTV